MLNIKLCLHTDRHCWTYEQKLLQMLQTKTKIGSCKVMQRKRDDFFSTSYSTAETKFREKKRLFVIWNVWPVRMAPDERCNGVEKNINNNKNTISSRTHVDRENNISNIFLDFNFVCVYFTNFLLHSWKCIHSCSIAKYMTTRTRIKK